MQKEDRCSPVAKQSSDPQTNSCAMSSCLFFKSGTLSFLIPFVAVNLIYQAGGSTCNSNCALEIFPGILAGLVGLTLYSLVKFGKRSFSHTSSKGQMPIQADYMRKTNLTIGQVELDENSALTPGSKEI
jgi:hypothetical protein